jgi:hypothetical protein
MFFNITLDVDVDAEEIVKETSGDFVEVIQTQVEEMTAATVLGIHLEITSPEIKRR